MPVHVHASQENKKGFRGKSDAFAGTVGHDQAVLLQCQLGYFLFCQRRDIAQQVK
jgi:hypothetical protein